ncbi:MAG: lysophospholipid acyltransferase family protein, partial [Terriglobia bacterium]
LVLWLGGIRFEVRGEENLPRGRACVYMSNHQSNLDPPMLFLLLPPRIAMMGKIQVFSVPVLGEAVRLADFVPVDRDNPEEARKSVEEALPRLRRGVSFLVFPEGRRSWDGRLLRFKHGVFLLAIRAGVPIVPITVDGVTDAMPKGKWEIYPGRAQVTIHPPIETRGMQEGDRARLAQQVRTIVDSALSPELRDPELTTAAATPPRQG